MKHRSNKVKINHWILEIDSLECHTLLSFSSYFQVFSFTAFTAAKIRRLSSLILRRSIAYCARCIRGILSYPGSYTTIYVSLFYKMSENTGILLIFTKYIVMRKNNKSEFRLPCNYKVKSFIIDDLFSSIYVYFAKIWKLSVCKTD